MKRLILFTAVLFLLLPSTAVFASENARTFMQGVEAYQNGDWQTAISVFEELAGKGVENGKLFYNLGNAYLKNDDLGRALLWYERALRHLPDDLDLRFNHDYALTLTKDEQGEKSSPLVRILFFWKYQLGQASVRWIAILLNATFWIALSILTLRKKHLLRPTTIIIAVATMIFTGTAVYNYNEASRIQYAVILPEQVAVRSGFNEAATQLFVLHAGTKVRIERESDAHLMIRYTPDKIGWVAKSDLGVI